jgi:hypothetical protein
MIYTIPYSIFKAPFDDAITLLEDPDDGKTEYACVLLRPHGEIWTLKDGVALEETAGGVDPRPLVLSPAPRLSWPGADLLRFSLNVSPRCC